jgi:hypothetical protein
MNTDNLSCETNSKFGFHIISDEPLTILTATRANALSLIAAIAECKIRAVNLLVMTWWCVLLDTAEHCQLARLASGEDRGGIARRM